MKKFLLVALAAVGMAACVQNEELAVVKNDAIAFDQYVNNATKVIDPSLTKDNIEDFQVWGYMENNTGTVFTGDEVTKTTSGWTYTNTQYWAPGKAYYFEAVAPATNKHWEAVEETVADIKALNFENIDGTEDLLYTYQEVAARDQQTLVSGVDPVQLQFGHLLSKVQFSFKSGFTTNNVTINVSDVRMTVPAEATVALDTKEWTGHANSLVLNFGAAEATLAASASAFTPAEKALLTIPAPATQNYEVKFNVQILNGAVEALNQEVTSTISGYALEVGKAYNFTAVIGPEVFDLQPIEFNVEGVDTWEEQAPTSVDYTVSADGSYLVYSAQGLQAVANIVNGGQPVNVVLMEDIDLSSLTRTAAEWTPIGTPENPFTGTFDGKGHTVSNFKVTTKESHAGLFGYAKDATIKNLSVENVTLEANSKAGGIVGELAGDSSIENLAVNNVTITGYKELGGVAGVVPSNTSIQNCTAEDVALTQDLSSMDENDSIPTTLGAVVGNCNEGTYENENNQVEVTKGVTTQEGFESALKLGGNIVLATGEYTFPAGNVYAGEVNVVADGENVVVNLPQSTYITGAALTLEGLTFKVPAGLIYNESQFGFIHHAAEFNMNNCVIEGGRLRLNVAKANINNCQFNVTASSGFDGYGLFYYGVNGSTVNVSNSTFTALQKAIVLYNEGAVTMNLNVDTCTFTASQTTDKAAISIHSEWGINGNVNINNSTATGFADYHGGLWRDVNNNTGKDNNKFTVIVDGEAQFVVGTLVSEGLYKDANGAYLVANAEGLATLNSKMVNKSAGQNVVVKLLADIDFTGKTWTPVDSHVDFGFTLKSINGNGHTISNLTINGQAMFSRFAGAAYDVEIKDLTFDNAKVNHNSINTAIIVGQAYKNVVLDNVDVKNSTIVGGYKVSTLIATVYNEDASTITATLKNCDVENTTVKALSYDFCTTGLVAFVYAEDNDKVAFENCTVSNVSLYAPNVYTAHAAIYTTGSETLFNEAEGVTVTNVTFENI